MSRVTHTLFMFAAALMVGCAGETTTEAELQKAALEVERNGCIEARTLCVLLSIPSNYNGQPRALSTVLYDSTDTMRPPDESLPTIEAPTIVPGETYHVVHTDIEFTGDYYLMFVLYDEDGGTWVPEAGLDYTVMTDELISFEGDAVDLGTLDMKVAQD